MKKDKKPYHIEAHELGVNNFKTVKNIDLCTRRGKYITSATEIRNIWDYRAASLSIDEAREKIGQWKRAGYHRYHRGQKQVETRSGGRILIMSQVAKRNRTAYDDGLKKIMGTGDGEMTWNHPRIRWEIAGRSIVTVHHEDVTWGDRKNAHYPESKTVSYTSHLIRTDAPGTVEMYKSNEYNILPAATEKKIEHSLRGNWRQAVIDELLPGEKYVMPPSVGYKAVAVVNGEYQSIFDGSPYEIGKRRNGTAKPDHEGGYYFYRDFDAAKRADVPSSSVNYNAPRVILKCEVGGKIVSYDSGKRACSWIQPVEVVD